MSFCLHFKRGGKYINTAEEIMIKPKQDHIKIAAFINEHLNQRVIVNCLELNDTREIFQIASQIKEANPNLNNYAILLPWFEKENMLKLCEAGIPFFTDYHCNSWEALHGLIKEGVSDIYITDGLGFELDKVSKICKKANVNVRVFCNVCQSVWKANTEPLLNFFIRPEDVDLYAHYVDVFELFGDLKTAQIDVLYETYAIQKKWFGPLREIILGFNSNLDSRYVSPNFATCRLRCNRSCMKGGECGICYHIEAMAEIFKEKGLLLTPIHK